VPDLGGTKRLNREYANDFKCIFYSAMIFSLGNGVAWPLAFGWFFPKIVAIVTDAAVSGESIQDMKLEIVLPWIIIGTYAFIVQTMQTYLFGIYGVKLSNAVKYDWFKSRHQLPR